MTEYKFRHSLEDVLDFITNCYFDIQRDSNHKPKSIFTLPTQWYDCSDNILEDLDCLIDQYQKYGNTTPFERWRKEVKSSNPIEVPISLFQNNPLTEEELLNLIRNDYFISKMKAGTLRYTGEE